MELLSKYIDCVLCKMLLNQPVLLPCKHSICKRHETEAAEKIDGTRMIKCYYCEQSFEIPTDGFPQTVSTIYVDANQDNLIKELNSMVSEILQQIEQALTDYVETSGYSEPRVHRVTNVIREKIVNMAELSTYYMDSYPRVMKNIDYFERVCKSHSSSLETNAKFIQKITDNLRSFESVIKRLFTPPITHETMLKWREISDKLIFHLNEIHSEFDRFNEELFFKHITGFNYRDLSDNSARNVDSLDGFFIFL